MNIAIVGQGAIGSIFTYYFRAKSPLLLVKNVRGSAKTITTIAGQQHALDFDKHDVKQGPVQHAQLHCIVISVKGYQLAALINDLQTWVKSHTRLILIQNGMGGAQALATAFPNNLIYAGITTDAVFESKKDVYQISAQGKLYLGPAWNILDSTQYSPPLSNQTKRDWQIEKVWITQLLSQHPNAQYHDNISGALYTKLAINAVINPLTATLGILNGQLRDYPERVSILKNEVFAIYTAHNIDYCQQALSGTIDEVMVATAGNFSSMYQDVKHNRQTENDTVLGYLLTMALAKNVSAPAIADLHQRLTKHDAAVTKQNVG